MVELIFSTIGTILLASFMSAVPYIFFLFVLEDVIKNKFLRYIVSFIITASIFLIAYGDNIQLLKQQ